MFSALLGPFGSTLGAANSAGGSPPVITSPSSLVTGTVGVIYPTTTFTATGSPTITWSIASGTLPTGMTCVGGVLSGTPTATASGSITFRATNTFGFADRPLTLTVNASGANSAPIVTTESLMPAVVGVAYSFTLAATGTPAPTWTLQAGTLPTGLSLSSSGVISGTPTVVSTAGALMFRVTNSSGNSDSLSMPLTVNASGGTTALPTYQLFPPAGVVGTTYPSTQFYANGATPITWSITSGSLPSGMSFSSSGLLSGTPTVAIPGKPITVFASNAYPPSGGSSRAIRLTESPTGSGPAIPTDVVTTALTATGTGTTYNVYNDTDMDNVPWGALGRGDVVNIYWKATPYSRKWGMGRNIANTGTAANPIIVNGVTDANGNRPRFNFNGATTARGSNPSLLAGPYFGNTAYDLYQIGNPYNLEDWAGILIRGFYRSSPEYIQIKNLEMYGARGTFTNLSNVTTAYIDGTSGIRVQNGNDVLIENCIIKDCAWGIFTQTNGPTVLDTVNRLTIRKCFLVSNGLFGSATEHNAYIQGTSPVIEGNYFGPLIAGADGSSYKSRASGEIFRYNWVEANARAVDLVEPEDQASGTVGIYDQTDYGVDHVYGNVITVDEDQMKSQNGVYHPFHFGSDKNYYPGFNAIYDSTGTSLAAKDAKWTGGSGIVSYNTSGSNGVWQAATNSTLTRAYYVNPSSGISALDNQPDNQQSCFVFWRPGVYGGSTVRKIFVQYSASVPRDGYEAELNATQVILRRNGTSVGTFTHGLTGLTTTQTVLLGVELSPGASSSVDVKVRCSTNALAAGYTAPVCITYNDISPLTGGHSGLLINDGGTSTNVQCATIQPSMGVHRYQFGSGDTTDAADGGYRQAQGESSAPTVTPPIYIGGTINGTKQNRRQLYFYNNTYVCNTIQNQVFFELNESTSTVDAWNNLFWVSCRGSTEYIAGQFKINERGGNYNFRSSSNIMYATADSSIRTSFPNNGTASAWTPTYLYNITGRTLPGDLNDPIALDANPLLTAVSAPTYNYLPTATYATTGGATSFPSGLPASFKSLVVQYQPGRRTNAMITRSSLTVIGAIQT